MWRNAHDTYLEDRVLSAGPLELVHLLYRSCITAVGDARDHLAEGRILERARSISKACAVLMELTTSLDQERGGEISMRLAQLYDYMHRRLVDANFRQSDEGLDEVARLLTTLQEGWEEVAQNSRREHRVETSWMPPEPEVAHASSSWSF